MRGRKARTFTPIGHVALNAAGAPVSERYAALRKPAVSFLDQIGHRL
jgi:hypothetical protein